MAWTLGGVTIRSPHKKKVDQSSSRVLNRGLDGSFHRDFVGNEKKIFDCFWSPMFPEDVTTILAAYNAQRTLGTSYALVISETGFSFSGNVLIELNPYDFEIPNVYTHPDVPVRFIEV